MTTITENVVNFMRLHGNQPKREYRKTIKDLKNELCILKADYQLDKKEFKANAVKSISSEIFEKLKETPKPMFKISSI